MNKDQDFNKIKENIPSLRERIEIGMRMIVKLLFESKNEHVMLVSFTLSKDLAEGKIDSVIHTSPGNGENVLKAALSFYIENNAEAHEETLSENT